MTALPTGSARRIAVAIAACCLVAANALAADRRPNVVLIMADDFGYECVAANGGESYQTPVLDQLAVATLDAALDSFAGARPAHLGPQQPPPQ